MKYVSIAKAAHLLGISRQRVQQLLYAGRIKGALKEGRFWQIPLDKHDMPQIIPGTRGPQGTWRKRPQQSKTYIHVSQHKIRENRKKLIKEPVICVRQGKKVNYCHQVDILEGICRLVLAWGHKNL
ncbi:helix-turn-helix domain-containing protein [Aphanothece sacrum]|uniref:Helix-turn-helix domain-containing protein n=1 Tax=Aphanothece sacrum FPU1 TaxID=1920663 RepID=A0A401IFK2_APHSA|nr:helix-turn-helix domain-containing protein [Aphanothece sacrum]GBF80058.1 hypothetical protein AsFPU1_1459 [Aphanothece sacrum FPU1]GBF84601.1 hypothetical protein AsFPU3_1653 [Aphanothece sacrum FPU3]